MNKTAAIAMSGGVDSSVAAYLLKQQGFDCIGVTMKLFDSPDAGNRDSEVNIYRSTSDIEDARNIADMIGIPHYVIDLSLDFNEKVLARFISQYQNGATPNPCVDCNRHIKFGALFVKAKELGAGYLATGHYARVEYDSASGSFLLKKALDESKDQSYVLYTLGQERLQHILFPLGSLTKNKIRAIAAQQGFISADKKDSQDICFLPHGDYAGFIEKRTGQTFESGNFTDTHGNILGRHKGHARYTVGQRKGLGLSLSKPMYVQSKDARSNTVTLCPDDELYAKTLEASDFNWIVTGKFNDNYNMSPSSSIRVTAKIRYNHSAQPAAVTVSNQDTVKIEFDEPQRAIAKGQAVVLYNGDVVVGGGTII